MSDESWARIEAEARAQVSAAIIADETAPLKFGQSIAWAIYRFGRTDDLSEVHRVGYPLQGKPHTTCGEVIPPPANWLVLNPRLAERMPPCRFCVAEHTRLTLDLAQEHAA